MAEGPEQRGRREEIERERLSSERGEVGSEAAQAAASQNELESLRLELARTRAELSGSVYELQGRMDPQYLKEQVRGSSSGLVKRNTAPLALLGAGLGWMIYNSVSGGGGSGSGGSGGASGASGYRQPALGSGRESHGYPYGSSTPYEDYGGSGDNGGQGGRGTTDQAREKASELGGRLSGGAGQAQEEAQQRAQQAQEEARQRAQQAKGGFQNMLQDNPLAVGAIAVGIGAAVGLSIPESEKENQAMGQTRDQLANRAQQQADDAARRAEGVAEQARNTAEQEARRQGLGE